MYSGEVHIHQAPSSQPERPAVFHNLPQPDYGRFIGREPERAKLHSLLAPHNRHFVITIDGIGGIGKSALALEIAHHYLRQFHELPEDERFEAIIWTSAKQNVLTAEGIRARRQVLHTLQDIYSAIAVALQREDITRASTEEQHAVVTRALTQQRTLLIVDNLETVDDEAVLDFLRELPAPTKAIVTTRHRIDVAYPVRLSGMPWEDGRDLIAHECEEKDVTLDEELTRQLYDRTGGVPLALVWSVAQMGFGYSPQAVLTRLGQPTNDITKFCFEGAVQRIRQTPAYPLLLALSLCADSASRETLGFATELPELDRDDGLVLLEKLSLVNKQGERFWLLPLTKGYVAAEFSQYAEREHLWGKWIEYFRSLSSEYSGEYWNWTNYDWLFAEGENILSIIDRAIVADHGEIALKFIYPIVRYLDLKKSRNVRLAYGEQFSRIAQLLNDKRSFAWICLYWLSRHYISLGNTQRAEVLVRQSLSLYKEFGDIEGICFAMKNLGRVLRRGGKYQDAEEICEQAMTLAEQHNYGDGIAYVHLELGRLARDRKQWKAAKAHLEAAIEWCDQHEEAGLDIQLLMAAIGNLGWIEFHLGNYQRGKELVEKSLAFFKDIGGKGASTVFHLKLAYIENSLGSQEEALKHLRETLFWAERLSMKRELERGQALLQELNAEAVEPQQQKKTP